MSSRKRSARIGPEIPSKRPGLPGGKRDATRRANQQTLCDAGLRLFLRAGYASVTIDEIVEAADMAKGSFYRYARDKPDLLAQIMAPVVAGTTSALDRCEQALDTATRATLGAIYTRLATELAEVVAAHPQRVALYLQESRSPATTPPTAIHAMASELETRTVALTELARREHLIRAVDPEIAALTVLGAVEAILFAFLRRRIVIRDPAVVTREIVETVLGGIAARA